MKKLLLILFLTFSSLGNSQETALDGDHFGIAFSPGIVVQRNVFLEANIFAGRIIANTNAKVPAVGVIGFRAGLETDFNRTIAPKIGYEIAILAITARLSAANYFQGSRSDFRLIPELGFTMGGWVSLTYGYGISFKNSDLTDIGHHRVSLSFNINKKLKDATFELLKKP